MEVKLTQKIHLPFLRCKTSFEKHFNGLAENWRFQLLEMSKLKGQLVKEGEKLNSISRHYGVSFHSTVAVDKNASDVEFLFKGQLPNIPAFVSPDTPLIKKSQFSAFYQKERSWSSRAILDGFLNQKYFITLTAQGLPHALARYYQAKSNGYFLVLVPLIAFCITCILRAINTRVPRDMGHQAVDESRKSHDGHRSMRWKNALSDIKELDDHYSASRTDFKNTSEDQDKNLNEDMSHAYRILEQDYQKFLSECGMSKSGYWRRGFHK